MGLVKGKKGIFFIFDALIFFIIISSAIALLPTVINDSTTNNQLSFISKDFMGVLMEMKVNELSDPWVIEQISNGNITKVDNSLLDQVGEFWSTSKPGFAYNLSEIIIAQIIPAHLGGGVWIDNELVYSNPEPPTNHIVSGRQIVSGLEKNKPLDGYVSRAWASNIQSNDFEMISISPEGAGKDAGNVVITKYFDLTNTTIHDAQLTLSVHADPQDSRIWVDFNNGQCHYLRSDLSWLFGSSEGNVGTRDVSSCLIEGVNKFQIYLVNRGYNAHIHPGTNILINLTRNVTQTTNSVNVNKRFYFDDVLGTEVSGDKSGAWASFPFYVPTDAFDLSVSAKIVGKHIYDYTGTGWFRSWDGGWKRRRDYDYLLFLNDNAPFDSDNHPSSSVEYFYNHSELAPNLLSGTNILSVYFNNYGDTFWGEDETQIFSDEYSNPSGSSYVEVNYTLPYAVPYGLVKLTNFVSFPSPNDNDKTVSFSYPSEAILKGESFINLVQRYSNSITVWADTFNPPVTEVFQTPSMRAVPTTTFIDNSNFELNPLINNYARAKDVGSGNEFIADYSSLAYSFYVPSFVSYKDVFSSEEEAIADALIRLNNTIGSYLDVSNILTSTDSITEVPTLWGPSVVEVRLWD